MSRKPKKAKAGAQRVSESKRLISDYLPPEGVPIRFEVSGLGARFGAQLLDILLTVIFVVVVVVLLAYSNLLSGAALFAIASILFFALRVPYYVITELLWNGQTLGKRITGLRVISGDGRSLSAYQVTVRNLMKEMEVFVPGAYILVASGGDWITRMIVFLWVAILLIVPMRSKRKQRMGDIIANTFVVNLPRTVLMPDLARRKDASPVRKYKFLPHQLDHYGKFELQTLENLLQVAPEKLDQRARSRHDETVIKVAQTISKRIEFTNLIHPGDEPKFLQEFYTTQRAYLENRKLFGDAREDKFHRTGTD